MVGKRTLRASCLILFLAAGALCDLPARADEITEFQFALNAYDSGDYETAVKRLGSLLEKGITNTALLVEVHKYLGASYMFTGGIEKAREQFRELILEEPDYELDPVLFPTEVLDEFWKVKKELEEELAEIEKSKKRREEELKEKREALKASWNKLMQMANHPPYIRQKVRKNHLLFALIPFGVGQMQNEHWTKGYLFLGVELALLAAAVTTYWLTVYYDNAAVRTGEQDDPQAVHLRSIASGLSIANKVVFWTLLGAMVAGVVDALIFFKKRRVVYEKVKESDIPRQYRARPVDVPVLDLDDILEPGEKEEETDGEP